MLIVRLPVNENWNPNDFSDPVQSKAQFHLGGSLDQRKQNFARARDRSVHLLGAFNGQHFITANLSVEWRDDPLVLFSLTESDVLNAIRVAEMEFILESSRAILSLPSGAYYLAPSRRLVRSFIRVGNIQHDRDAVDAIFFWLLPHLDGVGAILTDTWSISSIAFNVSRLISAYFNVVMPCVEMLPSYNDGSAEARQRSINVIARLDRDFKAVNSSPGGVLCLISATQTGSLESHLTDIFRSSDFVLIPKFVTLFRLGKSHLPTLYDLSGDARFELLPEENEESAAINSAPPIKIDPRIYFPLNFEDVSVVLDKSAADCNRGFFDRYVGTGLIRIHRDHQESGDKSQHHAIYLATEVLMDVPDFVADFEAKLADLPTPPLFIVSPPHVAGKRLADHASKFFSSKGHSCQVFSHPNLWIEQTPRSSIDAEIRKLLLEASDQQSILVLDDVCITGTRLSQYQRYIRTERYKGRIDYLVAVARPPNISVWEYYLRFLSYRSGGAQKHTVGAVDQVILPDWRHRQCPWCAESRLYQKWTAQDQLPSFLMDRLQALQSGMCAGLSDHVFMQFPQATAFSLGPDSLFAAENANQGEVFAAIAAALQCLRTNVSGGRPLLLGTRRFPIATVLQHTDYCLSKWTDSILRASIWRAASADELTYTDVAREKTRSDDLRKLLGQTTESEHEVALELLLAANEGKCSLGSAQELREISPALKSRGAQEVIEYLMMHLWASQPKR